MEWLVAGMALVVFAGVLGFAGCWPLRTLWKDRAERAERERDEARAALRELAAAERRRRDGAQADADHDRALRDALAGAAPDDPLAAALAVVRVARAREAAAAAAADPAGGPARELGAGADLAPRGPVGPDPPRARA